MGIFQRPDSIYWYVWVDGAPRPRVNTKIPIGTEPEDKKKNRQLAEQVYHRLMGDRARHRFGLALDRPARSFLQQRQWYLEQVSSHKRGQARERSMLKQLGAFFDTSQLAEITQPLAREWRTERRKAVSASTVRREEELLKHLLTTATPTYLERNPLAGLAGIRVADTDTRVLTQSEERRLLLALRTPEDRALVIGALDTLLRLSNIAHLTRRQDHRTYLFTDTKVGSVKVPISTRFRRALKALPKTGTDYFPTYATADTNNLVTRMFRAACERAKIPMGRKTGGVSFHCLRHTGASRMLEAGADVKTVMEIGGWKNLKVMERYLHPTDERKIAAVESISRGRAR